MLAHEAGVDEHSDRDEEHRGEEVAHGLEEVLDGHAVLRLGDERSGQERSERDRVAEALRQQREGETDPDGSHGGRLGAIELEDGAHQARNDQQSRHDDAAEKEGEPARRDSELGGAEAAGRERRQRGEQKDGDQILDDQDREHQLAQPSSDAQFRERLGDDGRAGDGHHGAREEALARRPPEDAAGEVSEDDLDADLHRRDDGCSRSHPQQLLDGEFETDGEEEQDDPELGEPADDLVVRHQRERHVRTDEQAGEDVPEHHGLAQALEHHGSDGGDAEHDRQVGEEHVGVVFHGARTVTHAR